LGWKVRLGMRKLRSSLAQENWIEQTKSIPGDRGCWQPRPQADWSKHEAERWRMRFSWTLGRSSL